MLWRRAKERDQAANSQHAEVLRCSFCDKSRDVVKKLISSPSDDPKRAYICDECVAICNAILDEDRKPSDVSALKTETDEPHPLLNHPLMSEFLAAAEIWIKQESLGFHAIKEFAKVRATAIRLMRSGSEDNAPK